MMDTVRRAVAFVLGAILLVFGVTGEAVQWDVVAVAASLMGLSSADQIADVLERHPRRDDHPGGQSVNTTTSDPSNTDPSDR